MRHGLDLLNIVAFQGLFKGAFAVAEARAGDYPAALMTWNHAASVIERTGERWFDAELHRTRGEILVKQNPADPAPAEAAFLTAIAIAQQQKARSFELRAALSLAKLFINRPAAPGTPMPCSRLPWRALREHGMGVPGAAGQLVESFASDSAAP